jgi:hypothetical protein
MWDRQNPRDTTLHDQAGSLERTRGSRGGRSERGEEGPHDARDVFVRAVDLPLGNERELVRLRERTHAIDGTDSRMLAAVGAFRVVAERDLESSSTRESSARHRVTRLEAEGLLQRTLSGPGERVVSLTAQGRDLLEAHRSDRDDDRHTGRQAFYAGVRKPRELSHDSQVYRAYLRAKARLGGRGARVRRVVLDFELKRDYQRFLQARNRGRKDHDGRPDREPEEIRLWAREHDLPYFDDAVHFPDVRIEYEDRDGRLRHEDVEVTTAHYRGAHAAATARCGFVRYRSHGSFAGGRGGGRRAAPPTTRLAEELL